MIQNKKIVQVVNYEKNLDFLKFRLEEQYSVDLFLIITTENEETLNQIAKRNNEKVKILNLQNCETELRNEILNLTLDFEDIIIISKENEFVDFDNFEFVLKNLKFNFQILNHKCFWWSPNYYSDRGVLGSVVLSFSQFLIHPNFFSLVDNKKNKINNFSDDIIQNGWSFNYFSNRPHDSQFFLENLLPYNSKEEKLKIFNSNFEVPNFFPKLNYENFELNSRNFKIKIDSIDNVEMPKNNWYEIENFSETFRINEYYNQILKKFPNESDIIEIIYNEMKYKFEFKELKNKFLSEIINPS